MGEAKRKREALAKLSPAERKALEITKRLADEGLLVEGGFAAYVINHKISVDDPRLPLLRDVYMHGAEHLW